MMSSHLTACMIQFCYDSRLDQPAHTPAAVYNAVVPLLSCSSSGFSYAVQNTSARLRVQLQGCSHDLLAAAAPLITAAASMLCHLSGANLQQQYSISLAVTPAGLLSASGR